MAAKNAAIFPQYYMGDFFSIFPFFDVDKSEYTARLLPGTQAGALLAQPSAAQAMSFSAHTNHSLCPAPTRGNSSQALALLRQLS